MYGGGGGWWNFYMCVCAGKKVNSITKIACVYNVFVMHVFNETTTTTTKKKTHLNAFPSPYAPFFFQCPRSLSLSVILSPSLCSLKQSPP
jgi:hypothetical protein